MTLIWAEHNEHLAVIDSVLPQLPEPMPADGDIVYEIGNGTTSAYGLAQHSRRDASADDAMWGALSRHTLDIRLSGDRREEALAALLEQWLGDIGRTELIDDWESSASVMVPSRDLVYPNELLRHGFAPVGVIGVRRRSESAERIDSMNGGGASIRFATMADLDLMADMDLRLLQHDSHFGGVSERPGARHVFRAALAERLAAEPEWTWVIERAGEVFGYAHAFPPGAGSFAAAHTSSGDAAAYIHAMYLDERDRGTGLGTFLIEHVHAAIDASDAVVTTLDYALLNPQSPPFWSRMGYRPLWTQWQRRPLRREF